MLDWMIRWSFMALAALPAYLAVAYARAALIGRAARKEYAVAAFISILTVSYVVLFGMISRGPTSISLITMMVVLLLIPLMRILNSPSDLRAIIPPLHYAAITLAPAASIREPAPPPSYRPLVLLLLSIGLSSAALFGALLLLRPCAWGDRMLQRSGCVAELDLFTDFPREVRIAPAGDLLAVRGQRLLSVVEPGADEPAWYVGSALHFRWLPDGARLAVLSEGPLLTVWDARARQELLRIEPPRGDDPALGVSADGATLAVLSEPGKLTLWASDTGALLREMDLPPGSVEDVSISPDGRWLARSGWDGVQIVDLVSGRALPGSAPGRSLGPWLPGAPGLFAADARAIYRLTLDAGTLTAEPIGAALPPEMNLPALQLLPDGRLLAAHADFSNRLQGEYVRVWSVLDDRTLRDWEFPEENIKTIDLTPDGRLLATVDPGWSLGRSRGGVLRLWRIPAP